MRKILVTGASGFIGSAAARALLAAGVEVHGTSASGRAGPPGVIMHRCDLLDDTAVADLLAELRPSHLLHVAWDVTHGTYWTSPANFLWLAAGARLLERFLALGGQRAVGVGSCAEYAWTEAETYTEVSSPLAPATPYGRCKLALSEGFAAAGMMGLSTAWARLFFPYGPGDGEQRFIPSMLARLRAGEAFDTTSGIQRRDFIHIDDVGAALAALTRSSVTGAVNIGTGEGVALREVALELAASLGAEPGLLRFGALPIRPGDPLSLIADASRLRHEVGFTSAISWREGLRRLSQPRG
ncbi:NAD-dependent epimerase/dehydratase family protein [Sediminicoccus sp. KRV36]|uniref:NAD-dependent epimerase/dehydratase family protein n=1 Tax=Sediminicoccus sp. KRV36 TaxID=3133721 RepID=UPI00200C4761|nr:NAD-dependent epimerase/dehydratase family protein [Sediminicoccus rosea]UPY37438.1 NAD-dependent epimerase/dehydratase family protein [Sediminicoccus rosea]